MDEQEKQEETPEEEKKVGLECLEDETLEKIVKADLRENNELTVAGSAAYKELKRRDPNYDI